MVGMSPLVKASLFMCCGLLLTFTTAEREYFVLSQHLAWDEARNHCQVCFKDLVTLTPENSQIIVQRLETAHWIGLRKHFPSNVTDNNNETNSFNTTNNLTNTVNSLTIVNSSSTNVNSLSSSPNSFTKTGISLSNPVTSLNNINNNLIQTGNTIISNNSNISNSNITRNSTETLYDAWSRWANEDTVIYQNWYPGWPKFKSPIPNINCCSCSCTCPAKPTSIMTTFAPFTDLTTTTASIFETTEKPMTTIQLSTTITGGPLCTAPPTTVTTTAGNTNNMESFLHTTGQTTGMASQESTTNAHNFLTTTTPTAITTTTNTTTNTERFLNTTGQTTVTASQESTTNAHNFLTTTTPTTITITTNTPTNTERFLNATDQSTMKITPSTTTNTYNLINSSNQSEFNTTNVNPTTVEVLSITTDKTADSPTTVKTTTQEGPTETSATSTTTFDPQKSSTGSDWTTTQPSIESTCEQTPMEVPVLAEINENYIEDSCVVVLRSGLWVERRCSEILPFVCYEDRFFGQVIVTNITSESATLTWQPGPGDISHYDVEVTGDGILNKSITNLTLDLFNLTAGGYYKVQVFPVKCDRRLNPQNVSFYTIPYEVIDLGVENFTEKSVFLMWRKQGGNADFYLVETENLKKQVNTTELMFDGLTPGSCYTFTIRAGVPTQLSNEANILNCTKPGTVSNLKTTDIKDTSITVSWNYPEGNFTGFQVTVNFNKTDGAMFEKTTIMSSYLSNVSKTLTSLTLEDLQEGTKITIQVRVLSIHSLMGDVKEITTYTVPARVKDLELKAEQIKITATWKYSVIGTDTTFVAILYRSDKVQEIQTCNTSKTQASFPNLLTATNYTVIVKAVKGNASSPEETRTIFTLPEAPTNLTAKACTKDSITLTWDVLPGMTNAQFIFNVTSYWNNSYTENADGTTHTFKNLVSGTRYDFVVYAKAGNNTSASANVSIQTEPDAIDVTLSMLCSSQESFQCPQDNQTDVLSQIEAILNKTYGNAFFWTRPTPVTSPNF